MELAFARTSLGERNTGDRTFPDTVESSATPQADERSEYKQEEPESFMVMTRSQSEKEVNAPAGPSSQTERKVIRMEPGQETGPTRHPTSTISQEERDDGEYDRSIPTPRQRNKEGQQMNLAGPSRRQDTICRSSNREFIAPSDVYNSENAHVKYTVPSEAREPRPATIAAIPTHLYNKSLYHSIDTSFLCESTYRFELQLKVLEPRLNEEQKFVIAAIVFPIEIIDDFLKKIKDTTPTFHAFKTHIREFWAAPQASVYSLDNIPPAAAYDIHSLIRLTANELNCEQEEQLKAGAIRKAPPEVRDELLALTYLPVPHFKQAAQAILDRQNNKKYALYNINQTVNNGNNQRFQNRNNFYQPSNNRLRDGLGQNRQWRAPQNTSFPSRNLCYYHQRFGPQAFKCEGGCTFNSQTFPNVHREQKN